MGQVWDLILTPAKQTVLLALADHADHAGKNVHPGIPLIAWKTGYSERQVYRIMMGLEDDGLLVRVRERKGKPTIYRIDLSKGELKPAFVAKKRMKTPDKMSVHDPGQDVTPDKMSPLTSHGETKSDTPDIASLNLSRIRHKDEPSPVPEPPPQPLIERPNIYRVWEENMGGLTQMIGEHLKDAVTDCGEEWVQDAIREAVENNVRKWTYVDAILKRWKKDGKSKRAAATDAKLPGIILDDSIVPDDWGVTSGMRSAVVGGKL